jgi:hypothetical protein
VVGSFLGGGGGCLEFGGLNIKLLKWGRGVDVLGRYCANMCLELLVGELEVVVVGRVGRWWWREFQNFFQFL